MQNCGANNDSLVSKCLFCDTALTPVDGNQISDHDLISEASTWYGVKTSLVSDWMQANRNVGDTAEGLVPVDMQGETVKVTVATIDGIYSKYKHQLLARSANNPALKEVYNSLEEDLRRGEEKGKTSRNLFFGIGVIVALAIAGFGWFLHTTGG